MKKLVIISNIFFTLKQLSKKLITFVIPIILFVLLYGLTLRGHPGIPNPQEIDLQLNHAGEPFETSQERSRYALILALYHDRRVNIDNYASMGTPDIGKIKGHYYSYFPLGTSILALPLYIVGLRIGATQLLTFLISTIFALATLILILLFAHKLRLPRLVGLFSALAFGYATNAWGYSVTLYAHLISAFFILLGLYFVCFFENHTLIKALSIWFLYGLSIFLDFPNLFIFLPIVILLTLNSITIKRNSINYFINTHWKFLLSPLIFVVLMAIYGYYNYVHFGNPLILSNTLPRVRDLKTIEMGIPETKKDLVGALNTRNMLEGIRSFTFSHDRGVLVYSPIILLFIFGIGLLKKCTKEIEIGLVAIPTICLILYSMFSDPYGGWAFGSRYMIAVFPELCILVGLGLQRYYKNILVKIIYSTVFIYSAAISLLAPITTNVIPPYVEARYLNLDSWFIINWRMLQNSQLNSFFYNHILCAKIPGVYYYLFILLIVIIMGMTLIWYPQEKT